MICFAIDMDAFYCGVEEQNDPSLRGVPFIVYQKQIVASASYPARALGVSKLDKRFEVLKKYPQVKHVNGESLAKYRESGRKLYDYIKDLTGMPVERLGLEEMRFEVTDAVEELYNAIGPETFGRPVPDNAGFEVELPFFSQESLYEDLFFSFKGKTFPPDRNNFSNVPSEIDPRFYLAGHLAHALKERLKEHTGLSSSIGVASSTTLAKMVCSLNKPGGITVLVSGHEAEYMKRQSLRSIPGFGRAIVEALCTRFQLGTLDVKELHERATEATFKSANQRCTKALWDLTHGIDNHEIKDWAGPQQVTVEDTFREPITAQVAVGKHVERLVLSAIKELRVVFYDDQWLAVPSSVRVTTDRNGQRVSRSLRLSWPRCVGVEAECDALKRVVVGLVSSFLKAEVHGHMHLLNIGFNMA